MMINRSISTKKPLFKGDVIMIICPFISTAENFVGCNRDCALAVPGAMWYHQEKQGVNWSCTFNVDGYATKREMQIRALNAWMKSVKEEEAIYQENANRAQEAKE